MDYLAFTKMRTQFLRYFYAEAAKPFREMRRKIEAHEPPFHDPPGYEDEEPPFFSEWQDAGDALDVLGQSAASLLSQTLKLYLEHWVQELRRRAGDEQLQKESIGVPSDSRYKAAFKKGWLAGYGAYCAALGVQWSQSPVDVDLLEQLVLARNAVQHSEDITSIRVRQSHSDAARFAEGHFADEFDIKLNESMQPGSKFIQPPHLDITDERLRIAIETVDHFCSWLDGQHPLRPSTRSAS